MRRTWQIASLLAGGLLMLVCLSQGAENSGGISGIVKGQSGKPVTGAWVTANNEDRGLRITVLSQEDGQYAIRSLPPGKYRVQGVGDGLQSDTATVEVDSTHVVKQDLALTSSANFKKTASMPEFATLMPEGEAKTIILSRCTDCHQNGLQEILFSSKSRSQWEETVSKMQNHPYGNVESLRITDAQKAVVIDYLTKNYGPDSPSLDLQKLPKILASGTELKARVTELDLPPGSASHDVTVDSHGVGWVGGRGFLLRVDPATLTFTKISLPAENSSMGAIQVGPNDRIWGLDAANSRFLAYDQASKTFADYEFPKKGRAVANTIRFHQDGTVWATVISTNQILHLDPATGKTEVYEAPGPDDGVKVEGDEAAGNAYGMAVAANQTVWFAEQISEKFARVDLSTGEMTEFNLPDKGTGLTRLRRMQADADGNIWCGEYGVVGKLVKLDARTDKIAEFPTPTKYSGAYSVDVERDHNYVWVSEMMADKIARFDPSTKKFDEFQIATRNSSIRRIEVDQSRPNRVWYSGNHSSTVGFLDIAD